MMCGASLPPASSCEAVSFRDLDGFGEDDLLASFRVFLKSAEAITQEKPALRVSVALPEDLRAVCAEATKASIRDAAQAQSFFETFFAPHRVCSDRSSRAGFVTAYYEPVVEGSLTPSPEFTAPILARPDNLVTLNDGSLIGPEGPLQAARMGADGLKAYADRAAIESGALGAQAKPLVWLRDKVEVFFIHVQGSARVRLPDGAELRLTYAGRNGHPYTSIGKILVEEFGVEKLQADMAGLKAWIRAQGQAPGELGAALMQRNKSYIFFERSALLKAEDGPIGGQGVSLTPFRSIALDRTLWPYGLPVWIDTTIPWVSSEPSRFRRLLIGQDTGSAILGAARGDLFFGSGDAAGQRAGTIRHEADFTVLLPRGSEFRR